MTEVDLLYEEFFTEPSSSYSKKEEKSKCILKSV